MVVEMENSRRPFDRSRDPSQMKKPRLSEESTRPVNSNVRQLSSQKTLGSVNASQASSRFRVSGRELESSSGDPSREAYQPQPVDPHYELVNQYKLALSDLTFNSKLIITNLTVIAGENVHAAKAVVGTICNHILEVPSEQKLPALYLLDSIVKNIGRDYIKYFAARLPEVFLKAYRHVEPPMQSNMRHLFRTWKGVFHPQTLQLIEKELGFNSRSDGSTDVTTTSADAQSHRPHHSIHVNPKYLERQRLQQSGQTKGIVNDVLGITPNLIRESDRLERVSSGASGGLWMDPAVKVNTIRRPQRDSHSEPLYEKDIVSIPGEYDFAPDLPQNSRSVIKKIGSRFTDDVYEKQWYGDMSRDPDLVSDQRDGLHSKSKISNYRTARLENSSSSGLSRNISVPYDSWKNSEEEEFMWDMHSRLSETDVATINPNNVPQTPNEERLESENHILRRSRFPTASSRFDLENATDSYSTEPKDPSLYDQWMPSPRSLHDSEVFSSIGATSTAAGKGIQTHARVAGSKITNSVAGSDRQSPLHDSTCIQNVTKQDFGRTHTLPRRDPRAARFPAKPQSALRDDSVRPLSSSSQLKNTNILDVPDASQVENFVSKPTAENVPGLTIGSKVLGQPNMSDLLQAVMKTGILSNNSTCGAPKDESSQGKVNPGTQTMSEASRSKALPPPLPVSVAGGNILARLEVEKSSPPLGSFPVSPAATASAQASKENNSKSSDPLSHLLSSLVSKGLISASNTKKPSLAQTAAPSVTRVPSTDHSATTSSMSVPVAPSDAQPSVLLKKAPSTSPKVKGLAAPSETTKSGSEGLIGLKFRAEKLRELHPLVISSLFDDLPHYCTSCGIRLKEKEELDEHMELHNKKRLELSDTNSKCRVWFPKADDWVGAKAVEVEPEPEPEPEELSESESAIKDGPAVVADENQCACILCGEMFEDYFSQETARWMFKGASYLTVPPASNDDNGPIVHLGCLTKSSAQSLGFGIAIKEENVE